MQDNGTTDTIEYTPRVNLQRAMTTLWELLESDYPDIRLNAARTLLQAAGMSNISVPSISAPAQLATPSPYPRFDSGSALVDFSALLNGQAAEADTGEGADQLQAMVKYLRSVDPSDTRPGEAPVDMLRRIMEHYRGSGDSRFADEDDQ